MTKQIIILSQRDHGGACLGNGQHRASRLLDLRPAPAAKLLQESPLADIPAWTPPPLSREDQQRLLADYNALMDQLAETNGGQAAWWATDLASKNRFTSPLAVRLNALYASAQALRALAASDESWQTLVVLGADRPLAAFLNAQQGPDLGVTDHGQSEGRLREALNTVGHMARTALLVTRRIALCRLGYGLTPPDTGSEPRFLVKSFAYPGSFGPDGRFNDPFFPDLAAQGPDCLSVVLALGRPGAAFKRLRGRNDVAPLEAYLPLAAPLAALAGLLLGRLARPFRVPQGLVFGGADIAPCVREILARGGWHMPLEQYLHRLAGRRLARRHRLSGGLLTYEGNPWERMLVLGLKETNGGIPISGCQHAAPPPAAAGIFPGPAECRLAPLPDRVLCTGPAVADLIEKYSALAPARVVPTCALRFGSLSDMAPVPLPAGAPTLLVALEGVPEAAAMLAYALAEATRMPEARLLVRAHPAFPFAKLAAVLGDPPLPQNVAVSSGTSLRQDIEAAHAVLYWGSTVAAEALLLGRPVLHFDRGDVLSYDFLFSLSAFKKTVGPGVCLGSAFNDLIALDDAARDAAAAQARQYVMDMFAPRAPRHAPLFFHPEEQHDSHE